MYRIDKILAHMGYGTRSEIKKLLKQGRLKINGQTEKDPSKKIDTTKAEIVFDGEKVIYKEFIYLMLNKPQGIISATEDKRERTVIDIIDSKYTNFELFPIGRLDKDTEGLLILTNDGKLAHELLSPKKHVPKTYFVKVEGLLTDNELVSFQEGIVLDDGYKTLPASLIILEQGELSTAEVILQEGKYHQIKRMFAALGKQVVYLKRTRMGELPLDEGLSLGQCRELTSGELQLLKPGN